MATTPSRPKKVCGRLGVFTSGGPTRIAFFRDGLYRQLGFPTLEDFVLDWEEDHLKWDANDLLAKIWTWQHGDISDNPIYRGDFKRALQSILARAIVLPCRTDRYFVPEDNADEVATMQRAELRVFEFAMGSLCRLAREVARISARARRSRRRIVERMKT